MIRKDILYSRFYDRYIVLNFVLYETELTRFQHYANHEQKVVNLHPPFNDLHVKTMKLNVMFYEFTFK